VKRFWQEEHLKPYNRNLKKLEDDDYYRAAEGDKDHTLYLMAPPQQTEEGKGVEGDMSLIPPPPDLLSTTPGELISP
jgi:hypothetical protein